MTARLALGALAILILAPKALGAAQPGTSVAPTDAEAGLVTLVAPRSSRLGQLLRRELQASGFAVVPSSDGSDQALAAAGVQRAVIVDEPGGRIWLVDQVPPRGPSRPPAGEFRRRALAVDRQDDLAPRRACLAVVEHLRAATSHPPATPAPLPQDKAPVPPAPEPDPTATQAVVVAPVQVDPPRPRPWSLGAGTAINFDGAAGEPTGHVQLVGERAVVGPLLGSVRLHWPLLGSQLHLPDRHVRLWTMGATSGLRLRLPGLGARLEPTVGVTGGLRFVLADSDWLDPRQSRVTMIPALCGGAFVGLRYKLIDLVHLTSELGGEWSRPLGGGGLPYEREAASSRATRVAIGVAFNY